jgi:signal transduction histidine kinase
MKCDETGMDNTSVGSSEPGINEEEERYRIAVEAAELGTWDFFPLPGKMDWSDRCRALFGVQTDTPLNYAVFLQHIYPDDREQIDRTIQKALHSSHNNILDCEFRTTVLHNDQPQWIRLKGKVFFNTRHQACRIIGTVLDITEKKEYERLMQQNEQALLNIAGNLPELEQKIAERTESLKKLTVDLERSNQNLEEFAFMASHDLQEPLRKIRIFTQLLQDKMSKGLNESGRLYLDKINSAAIRMGALIRSLLDYSRLSGKAALFIRTDVNEIIKTVISDLDITISRTKAIIDTAHLPVIEAIPIQIVQLFTNLISNALKFACENVPPVIRITSRVLLQPEVNMYPSLNPRLTYTEIKVTDNGIGFDPAFSEQIFGIFQRLHGQNQYEGTGIGLSICRKIATNHNGLIFADSKKQEGTTFHVILPVKQMA